MLTFDSVHVHISVSVGDTLEREPAHICKKDPTELIRKFMEELMQMESERNTRQKRMSSWLGTSGANARYGSSSSKAKAAG